MDSQKTFDGIKTNNNNFVKLCGVYCLIALIFLFAMIFTMNSCKNIETTEFQNVLSPEQYEIYKQIVKRRMNDWVEGMIVGMIIGLIIVYLNYDKMRNNKLGIACLFTSVTLFVNYMYYTLKPKPVWMLNYLTDMKQVKEWLDVYKMMKFRYHLGAVFGIIAYFILSFSVCKLF